MTKRPYLKKIILTALALPSLIGCAARSDPAVSIQPATQGQASAPASRSKSASIAAPSSVPPSQSFESSDELAQARLSVEQFFGEPFPAPYDVKVFPNRAALTDFARQRWGMEKTECWMVAMGVSSLMAVLSPEVWKTEACEHEPTPQHIREIFTHELVHVFHGQHNPSHEFDGMDDAGWFVEGLAILAAGQLSEPRLARLRAALAEGHAPTRLADAWSGPHRYAISGSLVRFVEARWGRATLKRLLPATTNAEILTALETDEASVLAAWRAWLNSSRS